MKTNEQGLDAETLDWIQLRDDIGAESLKNEETFKEKFNRKFSENPFVPIGCGLTSFALLYGLWSFRQGYIKYLSRVFKIASNSICFHRRPKMSQNMMRLRIGAQGFTIVALMVGVGVSAMKQ